MSTVGANWEVKQLAFGVSSAISDKMLCRSLSGERMYVDVAFPLQAHL